MRKYFTHILIGCVVCMFVFVLTGISYGQLIINEIHADPASGMAGDANGDGIRDPDQDEFIEFVNTGSLPLDISGYKLFDTNSAKVLRHEFPPGTVVRAGGAIVVFGGGTVAPMYGDSPAQKASNPAGIAATNGSETFILEDPLGIEVLSYTYGSEGNNDQSITRSPDVTGGDAPMTLHTVASGTANLLYSPGTRADGTPFGGIIFNEIHADPASDITGDANGDGSRSASEDEFIELVNSSLVDIDISGWKLYDNVSSRMVRHVFLASTIVPAGGAIVIFGGGTPTGTFGGSIVQKASTGGLAATNTGETFDLVDDLENPVVSFSYGAEADNDQSITRSPDVTGNDSPMTGHASAKWSGGKLYSPGTRVNGGKFIGPSLIINEFMAWPAGSSSGDPEVDTNGDGVIDFKQDEFIEFVNTGATDLDVSGWTISDELPSVVIRHTFEAGTIIPAGGSLVIFGGGTATGDLGGAAIAYAGDLGLTNGGDGIIVKNTSDEIIIHVTYGAQIRGTSETLNPDLTGTSGAHPDLNGNKFSPGKTVDGNPFLVSETTQVKLAVSSLLVNEGSGTVDITVSIEIPSASAPTSVDLVLTSGSAADINNYTTQTVTFLQGSSDDQTVTITLTDDGDVEPDEDLVFELQNVAGGTSATIGSPSTITITIQDNDFATSNLIINEYLAWPAGGTSSDPVVDANGDGAASTAEDEFIEFVNTGTADIDISGWIVYDEYTQFLPRHVFPSGTIINPGGALVVFGGGNPTGEFGGAQVQKASTGGLGLTNTNDGIWVKNTSDETIIYISYGEQKRGTSTTLDPDITGAYTLHPVLGTKNISPGTKVDGSPFAVATRTNVQFASIAGGLSEDGGTYQIELSIVRPSETEATTAEVAILTGGFSSDITYTTQTVTFPAGSSAKQMVTVTVVDDDLKEGDELFQFAIQNVGGGTNALAAKPDLFEFTVNDDDVPLIFNEIFADPSANAAGDANNDGTGSTSGDEFIEVINQSSADVDMSGWTFHVDNTLRHTFPQGTVLEPGRALVVFGGGIPTGLFGGSEVQLSSTGTLSLPNAGAELKILDLLSELAGGTKYGTSADNGQSITRSPDITGGLAVHSTIAGAGGTLFSPGTKSNGNLFVNLITGFDENEMRSGVYPNPAEHDLTIALKRNPPATFKLYDVTAREVMTLSLTQPVTNLPVTNLGQGIYFYTIVYAGKQPIFQKGKLLIKK